MEKFILELLIESGKLLLEKQEGVLAQNKSEHDLVTDADVLSEQFIISKIKEKFPEHKIYSEESEKSAEDLFADDCWVIDPLDGTNNYAYGFPIWGTSIAYAKKGCVVAGGVSFPSQRIYLLSEKEKGVREYKIDSVTNEMMAPVEIRVSKRNSLEKTMMLICHAPHTADADKNLDSMGKISNRIFNVRNLGAAVYNIGYIAMGLADACVEFRLHPHDGAAGWLLVEEAGGEVTDIEGRPWKLDSPSMVATNGLIHQKIIDALKIKN